MSLANDITALRAGTIERCAFIARFTQNDFVIHLKKLKLFSKGRRGRATVDERSSPLPGTTHGLFPTTGERNPSTAAAVKGLCSKFITICPASMVVGIRRSGGGFVCEVENKNRRHQAASTGWTSYLMSSPVSTL